MDNGRVSPCDFRAKSSVPSTILLVDDNADLLLLQKFILEREGFKVLTASGGQEAYQILGQNSGIALILLDVRMEDMSGPEFLDMLEQRNPEVFDSISIVFLTAMDEVPKSRTVGFIRKGLGMVDFINNVHRFI